VIFNGWVGVLNLLIALTLLVEWQHEWITI